MLSWFDSNSRTLVPSISSTRSPSIRPVTSPATSATTARLLFSVAPGPALTSVSSAPAVCSTGSVRPATRSSSAEAVHATLPVVNDVLSTTRVCTSRFSSDLGWPASSTTNDEAAGSPTMTTVTVFRPPSPLTVVESPKDSTVTSSSPGPPRTTIGVPASCTSTVSVSLPAPSSTSS